MLVKELRGTESTQDACAKMRVKHNLKHNLALLFMCFLILFSESFSARLWDRYKRDLLLIFSPGWLSVPPPPNSLTHCCYPSPAIASPCILLQHRLPLSLLVPLFISHTLVLSCCSVKRHFNIHENPIPLVFMLTSEGASLIFWKPSST